MRGKEQASNPTSVTPTNRVPGDQLLPLSDLIFITYGRGFKWAEL